MNANEKSATKETNHAPQVLEAVPNTALPIILQLLARSDAVVLTDGEIMSLPDKGMIVTTWTTAKWIGQPDNEVVRFSWIDGEQVHSEVLTEEGINNGAVTNDGKFVCENHEGNQVAIRFFSIEPLE